jgi:aminopeptidase YwaD
MRKAALIFTIFMAPAAIVAQEQPNPKTLLPQSTIEAIVNEVSGTLAYNFILDLAGYEHDRLAEEYRSTYREAAYIEKMAKQYGLEDVHIERFKIPTKTWDGELGELWLITPKEKRLLISYRDIPAMLATGSQSGDVTAEVVYVGRGEKDADYTGKDVKGKLVLASGSVGTVHNLAVRKYGAEAVITYNDPTGKPIDHPDQIAWNGIGRGFGGQGGGTQKTTFGFNISHRLGMELLDMLERGEKVTLRARAKTAEYDTDMQVPTAIIRGNGESQQEIAMTGHLFEGIAKQGAMDDASGSAVALEVARAWTKLIADGVLPRPRRTVRFLWIPEIQGTRAYLLRYPEEAKRMVAAISMDMVGEDTTKNKNSLHLMRTPYSSNGFINEVSQQFFEYVGDTNREKVQNRRIAYSYLFPILDPQGTRDQFNYVIDKHYGSSDHAVFLGMGIPAVLYNNWPDIAYHTSEDRPFNADPTELKRVAFIGLASMHVMASAGPLGAIRIAELSEGYSAERTATELRHAMQLVGDGNADAQSYREALNLIQQAYAREGDAIRSAIVLAENPEAASQIDALAKTFVETGERTDVARLKEYATLIRREAPVMYTMNAAEKEAAGLIPVRKKPAPQGFGGGGGGGGQGGPGQGNRPPLAGFNAMEARNFADGKRSILDIRDAVSAEFGPLDAAKFVEFFRQLEKTGEFALNSKTDTPTSNQ